MRVLPLNACLAMVVALGACTPDKPSATDASAPPSASAPASQPATQVDASASAAVSAPDPANATYDLEGESIVLVNGVAEGAPVAPGSATRERTTLLGSPVHGDLDGDGREDAAVLLANEPGGSGTFVYMAAVLQGRQGTHALLLGDRIGAPKLSIENGVLRANFLDRADDASFADAPTVPRVVEAKVQSGQLVAVSK